MRALPERQALCLKTGLLQTHTLFYDVHNRNNTTLLGVKPVISDTKRSCGFCVHQTTKPIAMRWVLLRTGFSAVV
jgi:hypothetical protein